MVVEESIRDQEEDAAALVDMTSDLVSENGGVDRNDLKYAYMDLINERGSFGYTIDHYTLIEAAPLSDDGVKTLFGNILGEEEFAAQYGRISKAAAEIVIKHEDGLSSEEGSLDLNVYLDGSSESGKLILISVFDSDDPEEIYHDYFTFYTF